MLLRRKRSLTPIEAAAYGAAAGLAGALAMTVLARITPGLNNASKKSPKRRLSLPDDVFDPIKVAAWQDRARSPGAYASPIRRGQEHAAAVTPAGALAEAQGPGAEGAAEQFVVKLGSGLFGRDFTRYSKPAGKALHFVYGALWGAVYGILQGRKRRNPWLTGTGHGLFVWSIASSLLPAMRLALPLRKAPKTRTAVMAGCHLVYGVTVAKLFEAQIQRTR